MKSSLVIYKLYGTLQVIVLFILEENKLQKEKW